MKKLLTITIIVFLMIPVSLMAQAPTDKEVEEATIGVVTLFGMVFMLSMFETTPENVTVESNVQTGETKIDFDNFSVDLFLNIMSRMTADQPAGNEQPTFSFSAISGTIEVNGNEDLLLDVALTGGNVKTLEIRTNSEDIEVLKANGREYTHLNQIFNQME